MTDQGGSSEEAALTFAEEVGADMLRLDRDRKGPVVAGMLDEARALAQRFNVSGTPTFVINGLVQNGYVPADRLDSLIRQAKAAVAKADSDS
jgi:protein-disulfide isomerase